jgi:hypothetical protein
MSLTNDNSGGNKAPMSGTDSVAPRRISVTPTRNEAWVIRHFLAAARTWADEVIVADQGSVDGTWEHLQNVPGVRPVKNDLPVFDESHRQKLLLSKAREVQGKRILIGLDADEALSANCLQSREWRELADLKPGTIVRFRWVNILPGFKQAWIPPEPRAFGFIDDGSEHEGKRIHSPRVPQPVGAPVVDLKEVVVLHFQYVVWERMVSKHRWYQAWEFSKNREKGPLRIFREYNHMYGSWDKGEIHPVKSEWLEGYDRAGIDFRSLKSEAVTNWDKEVLQMLREHGPEYFRRIAIWDKDWKSLAHELGVNGVDLSDPRSPAEKAFHRVLTATQARRSNLAVRGFEKFLRSIGW